MTDFSAPSSITTRGTGIKYGGILGLILIAYFMILISVGSSTTDSWIVWSYYILTAGLIFLAQVNFKQIGDGYMSYGQGLGIAFWTVLVSSVMHHAFSVSYMTYIDPDFARVMQDAQRQAMEDRNLSDEEIEAGMKMLARFSTPGMILIIGIVSSLFTGMLVALITTLFTRRENPNMPE